LSPILRLLFFVPLFGATLALATRPPAQSPPRQPFEFSDWPATMTREPSKGLTLGTFRIQYEATTLAEVQRAARAGSIEQQGDAAENILWLCYTSKHRGSRVRIWIVSSGEMGGDQHAVTEVAATALNKDDRRDDCPSLPATMQPASLDSSLWLGSSDAELDRMLGSPSRSDGAWRSFDFEADRATDCGGQGSQLGNWLVTKSAHGYVVTIFAGQITSC
jgi:hypothetical protein